MTQTATIATFKNRNNDIITTGDPTTAQYYRERVEDFTEIETEVVPYSKRRKGDLEAEVAQRNTGRGEGELIEVDPPGNIADLVAALEADDKA